MSPLALVTALVAVVAAVIAALGPRSVRKRPPAAGRLVGPHLEGADYVDNYSASVRGGSRLGLDAIEAAAVQKGRLVNRSDAEVVFTDRAPGLRFFVAYALGDEDGAQTLDFTTAVHYTSTVGRIYFFFVRPFHRLGLPWLTRWTLRRALAGGR